MLKIGHSASKFDVISHKQKLIEQKRFSEIESLIRDKKEFFSINLKNYTYIFGYDSLFDNFVATPINKDSLSVIPELLVSIGRSFEECYNRTLISDERNSDYLKKHFEALKGFGKEMQYIIRDMTLTMPISLNPSYIDDYVSTGQFDKLGGIIKNTDKFSFNWNLGNGYWFDIFYSKEKEGFYIECFESSNDSLNDCDEETHNIIIGLLEFEDVIKYLYSQFYVGSHKSVFEKDIDERLSILN